MKKEHVIDLETGKIAYPDAHTTAGRLAYIELYRSMGHREWEKKFIHIYIGDSLHKSTKADLIKFGLWAEHCQLMNEVYQKRINDLKQEIKNLEIDKVVVSYSKYLIEDEIDRLKDQIDDLKRMTIK